MFGKRLIEPVMRPVRTATLLAISAFIVAVLALMMSMGAK